MQKHIFSYLLFKIYKTWKIFKKKKEIVSKYISQELRQDSRPRKMRNNFLFVIVGFSFVRFSCSASALIPSFLNIILHLYNTLWIAVTDSKNSL